MKNYFKNIIESKIRAITLCVCYILHKFKIKRFLMLRLNPNVSLKRFLYLDRKWCRIHPEKYLRKKEFYDFLEYEGIKTKQNNVE